MFFNKREIALTVLVLVTGLAIGSSAQQANQGDVRSFGAAGDGKNDDTAAIQKAVDSGLGAITLSKGVYRITRHLVAGQSRESSWPDRGRR